MSFVKDNEAFEEWLASQCKVVWKDIDYKHHRMEKSAFIFLRATYFRWARKIGDWCPELMDAPPVRSVGDLHLENFGTWRDRDGRLVWGVNDFDEAAEMPYSNDLVRLTASVRFARQAGVFDVKLGRAAAAILKGYRDKLAAGGLPFVLEERHPELFPTNVRPETLAKDAVLKQRAQDGDLERAQFLRFTSPERTPHPENDLVNARWFPAPAHKDPTRPKQAIVVLPQWNADAFSHNALCTMFNRMGISALRLSLPYHDGRMPAELQRADYAVSANIGRTIDATRQAVIDSRACFDWLEQQGFTDLGIVGTSLGSCYAFLASAHDERLRVNVFNHCSAFFADVVWSGLSTQHIRKGLESDIDVDRLRAAKLNISQRDVANNLLVSLSSSGHSCRWEWSWMSIPTSTSSRSCRLSNTRNSCCRSISSNETSRASAISFKNSSRSA